MGYRVGDETVEVEAKIEHATSKAVLIEPTLGDKCWIPRSQIIQQSEPDGDGNVILIVKMWIAEKNGLV